MLYRTLAALFVLAFAASSTAALARGARDDNWVLVGTRSVDLKKERDRIDVGASKGRFSAIVLVGMDRLIDIHRVTVVTDGEPHVIRERMKLEDGHNSRPYSIGREGRIVRHVELAYRLHLGAAGPAKVELWGLRVGHDAPVARSEPPPTKGVARTPLKEAPAAQPQEETAGSDAILFGVHQVGTEGDQDVFKLGREYGRFGRLRLRARDAGVNLRELRVIYAGGEPDVLAIDAEIPADQFTRWINLKGDRFIRELHLVYGGQSRSKARLDVYGEYAASWFRPSSGTGAFSSANDGWLFLGGQSPLFVSIRRGLGYETDVVQVARNRGFRNLRLDVKDRAITLNQITVVYSDGSSDIFADRQRVDGGSSYGPVELKSRRPVKEIQVSYRSRIFDSSAQGSGYAFVEFWAK